MSDSVKGGNDTLRTASAGSTVSNTMWGDGQFMSGTASGGQDTFVFKDIATQTVGTQNFVEDFSQSQHDQIQFNGVAGVTSFASLGFDTTTNPGSTIINGLLP
jgi:hypothetical protein